MSEQPRILRVPRVGSVVDLPYNDGTPTDTVEVFESFGVARLCAVETEDGAQGVVAFQPDGSWWWVRTPERKEPWEGDGDGWRA